jgi:hypothetical protein
MNKARAGVSRRSFLGGTLAAAAAAGLPDVRLAARGAFGEQVMTPSAADLKLTGTPDEAYWWKVRGQFNIIDGMTFMNNGTEGPVPRTRCAPHWRASWAPSPRRSRSPAVPPRA